MGPIGALCTATVIALAVPGVAHAGSDIIVAPKAQHKAKRSPVRISVRAAWEVRTLRVRLNGVNLSPEFRRADIGKRNLRTVRVSASHGLRYGKNVLRVTKKRFGHKRRRDHVRFRLTRGRPLVGAGRDQRIVVGRSVSLDGRASRPRDAPRTGSGLVGAQPGSPAGLRMRWRLIRKPAGSKATLRHARGVQPSSGDLASDPGPMPVRPRLKHVDEPGRYVAELVVLDGAVSSAADRVVTTALAGTPLVPVDTAATICPQGAGNCSLDELEPGIAVGYHPAEQGGRPPQGPNEEFFPLGQGNALQLVVLARRTLETVDTWSGSPSNQSIATLTSQLKQYDDSRLAIVTAWFDAGWSEGVNQPTAQLTNTNGQGVNLIGAAGLSAEQIKAYGLEHQGQLTWIGAPGFARGDAWQMGSSLSQLPPSPPSVRPDLEPLRGFLSHDNNDNYAYVGPSPTTYDLGPDGQSVQMTIGSNTFNGSLPAGEGGFLVEYLDARTLDPVTPAEIPALPDAHAVYTTRNADGSPNYSGISSMTDDLRTTYSQGQPVLVAIRSIGAEPLAQIFGQPPNWQGSADLKYADALVELSHKVGDVGGHRQLIWGMATHPTGQDSYSLIGSNANASVGLSGEGSGTDLGSQLKPQGQRRLGGILDRDKQSRYIPKVAASGQVGGALAELALAEPTQWPNSSTAGEQAALACIGTAQGLGADPRVAYWTQTYTETSWLQTKQNIEQMPSSACSGVDASDFTAVRDELVTEIGWLINVNSYTQALTHPFTDSGLSSWADLNTITQAVVGDVSPPPTRKTSIDGMAIAGDVFDLVSEFEVPGAGAVGGIFFLMDDVTASSDDGPTIDWGERVEAASANVGEALAGRLQMIADGNEQLADIIAADYAKLKTVGTLGQCTPGENGCTPQWQFTQAQQNAASRMYEINAKREIWGGVLPAAYPFVLYTNSDTNTYHGEFVNYSRDNINGITCGFYQVFHGRDGKDLDPPSYVVYGVTQVIDPPAPLVPFMVFSQQNFDGDNDVPDRMFPSPGMLSPLFTPLDPGGDPDEGGLGLDQYAFMIDNWQVPNGDQGGSTRADWRGC